MQATKGGFSMRLTSQQPRNSVESAAPPETAGKSGGSCQWPCRKLPGVWHRNSIFLQFINEGGHDVDYKGKKSSTGKFFSTL